MFLTRLKAGAVVLLASCTMASLTTLATEPAQAGLGNRRPATVTSHSPAPPQDPAADAAAKAQKPSALGGGGGVQSKSKSRMFMPDGKLIYVNVYTTDPNADQKDLTNSSNVFVMPRLERRIKGMGIAAILGNRTSALRIRLDPVRLRAHNLSSGDIMKALTVSTMVGPDERLRRLSRPEVKMPQSTEYVLTYIAPRYNKPEQYSQIILKADPDGEVLRLREVGEVELSTRSFDNCPEINGHPAAAIVLKPLPGRGAAIVIEAIKEELEQTRKESFPSGMNFEINSPEDQGMIYAVIETSWDSPLEYTSAVCRELEAVARGIDDITSVSSLAGYDVRTEDLSPHAGTCLIHLKNRPDRKLTPRQIIETLEEKCRAREVEPECFEPPAISVFVAAGGFSVRVLDRTNANDDRRPGGLPATSMDDLLNRKDLEGVFAFFAGNYPQHELVINNDVAMQKGVSIASALEKLPRIVGGDVQSERTLRRFVEDPSNLSFKNDRGEQVPYRSFMQFKKKQGLNESGR